MHEDQYTFMIISRLIFRIMINVFDKSCREIQNKYFISNKFFSENRAVYEIERKNMVQPDRPQMKYNTAHALRMLGN